MAGKITSFADNDEYIDGLDGRDISISWTTISYVAFQQYNIYLLPA
jgi:hypothetical protein